MSLILLNRFFHPSYEELLPLPRKTGWIHQGYSPSVLRSSGFALGASKISDLPQLHGLCKHLLFWPHQGGNTQ